MANEEHLKILRQGVKAWNAWRVRHPREWPDLEGSDLENANLENAKLAASDLRSANLLGASLAGADLAGADLFEADLAGADLSKANLGSADLRGAYLRRAVLTGADLTGADLRDAQLSETVFGFSDLKHTKGLESINHHGPSVLGVEVLRKSQGQVPAVFLKGCGLSDWEVEAAKLHDLNLNEDERTTITYEILRIQGEQPIQLHPLFVSYSHTDAPFVNRLGQQFAKLGVRFWRDVHDLKAGRLETQIDRAIRLNPTVLLVLSEKSVESDWVEWEVGQARKLEKEVKRDVLCPVALDDTWKTCSWEGPLRKQIQKYHILDFSAWREKASFEGQFGKLLEGLRLFYRREGSV